MTNYTYQVSSGQTINRWQHSSLSKQKVVAPFETMDIPVNLTEGYLDIEYPVRTHFLKNKPSSITIPSDLSFPHLYVGFDNPRVDFSSFLTTPHWLQTYLRADFIVPQAVELEFDLITCGRVCIWVNQEQVIDYQPYTRNFGSQKQISLSLKAGTNAILVYMDELAERDVNFYTQLKLKTSEELLISLPLTYEAKELTEKIAFLESLYFAKDFYTEGIVNIEAPQQEKIKEVELHFNQDYFRDVDEKSGNIADFQREQIRVPIVKEQIVVGKVAELPTSGLTKIAVKLSLPDGSSVTKSLRVALYNRQKLAIPLGDTLSKRKKRALEHYAQLEMLDLNSGIAELALTGHLSDGGYQKLRASFTMIKEKGDCADFMFAPLLAIILCYQEQLEPAFLEEVKELALTFRYWIDESGDDVMWYFSENHALLFHSCQYFAGELYGADIFTVSQRLGSEQKRLGKERLEEWFSTFFTYGFSEWNSTTYLPIDLIGFFALYLAAPDQELKLKAKAAIDYTFKMIAINHHGGLLASTYGRVYEHDLKAMELGEISNILAIAWNQGHFNNSMRSPVLFALSDYEPPTDYQTYLLPQVGQALKAEYTQGIKQVYTYLYKTVDYSLASAIDFQAYQKGHQQHLMNLSLGSEGTQLWLNHPGELAHSGENRPSFWAGNGTCPKIFQVNNLLIAHYQLATDIPFIHLYLPYWALNTIKMVDNWLYLRKDQAYVAIYFSAGFELIVNGDTQQREIRATGTNQYVLVKCSSKSESGSFDQFVNKLTEPTILAETLEFTDSHLGNIRFSETGIMLNNQAVLYSGSYEIKPQESQSQVVEEKSV